MRLPSPASKKKGKDYLSPWPENVTELPIEGMRFVKLLENPLVVTRNGKAAS